MGVGERRGVGTGVNAGCGVAVGLGAGVCDCVVGDEFVAAGVVCGADAVVVAGCGVSAGTICPDSTIRPTFSLLISNSILPLAGAGGGAISFPFTDI